MASLVDSAIAEARAGHDQASERLLLEAVRRNEDADVAWAWLAHRAADADRWGAALRACDAAIKAGAPPWWVHQIRGVALTHEGRGDEAILVLQRAASEAPEHIDVALAQVRAAVAAGETGAAHNAVARAHALAPDDVRVARASALVALRNGQWDSAIAALNSVIALGDCIDTEVYTNLAVALCGAGRESEAGAHFRRAAMHGEVTEYHRITAANLRRHERRFPREQARRNAPRSGEMARMHRAQTRVLTGLFILVVAYVASRAHILGTTLAAAGCGLWYWHRRHVPRGRYRALPDYVAITVDVGQPDR